MEESTLRLRAIFDNAVDGIIIIDERGKIEEINPSGVRMFEYTPEEVIGHNVKILMPEPDKSRHDDYIENYKRTGERKIIGIGREVLGRKKNGTTFPFKLSVSEVILPNRRLFTGIIHDISDIKNAEEKLKHYAAQLEQKVKERTDDLQKAVGNLKKSNLELNNQIKIRQHTEHELIASRRLYITIAQNFPNGFITVFDRDFCCIFAEGKNLKGFDPEGKLLNNTIDKVFPDEFAFILKRYISESFAGENVTFEFQYRHNYYLINTAPMTDLDDTIVRVMVVGQNITDRKIAEEETKNALHKEKQLNELKSGFVSMASHEFRTPLGTILSSLALVSKYDELGDDEKKRKHIARIKDKVDFLTQLLNDFLSLGKIEEGKVQNEPQNCDIKELFGELCEEVQTLAKTDQKIIYRYSGALVNGTIDAKLLKTIITNLLTNAVKYSGEGTSIAFDVEHLGQRLHISVQDQGIGIPYGDQKYLFDIFFRAHNAQNIQGTGLGLHIVKRYINIMGGEISFESLPGKGTTFSLWLPLSENA